MANIMSLKSLRNKTSRNGFDLSSKRNFTAKAGELLPVRCWEVLPGDSWSIDLKSFTRTQPLNTAAFARMREYYDFYFVPYNLIWNKANTVLTQMYDNVQHAVSFDSTANNYLAGSMPYTTCQSIANYLYELSENEVSGAPYGKNYFGYSRAKATVKLLDYLGYGNYSAYANGSQWSANQLLADLNLNIFGLAAYQKIYADHIRDSQWERVSPSCFNVDYLSGIDTSGLYLNFNSGNIKEYYNMLDLRYCNWQKDLFHGVLPRQQYGNTATAVAPLTGNVFGVMSQTFASAPTAGIVNSTDVNLHVNGAISTANAELSILALRQAEFLQKWKEITQSGNKDYKDQIEKHWNVSVGEAYSEMSLYLGGTTGNLDINEVVNNNITGDNAADIAGKGTVVNNGRISFNAGERYGLIMCIYHCMPLLDYTTDMVSPVFTKVNATDFAISEFDRVGMESVPVVRMFNPVNTTGLNNSLLLGYAPRYIDYKTDVDSSVGAFKTSLKNWIMSYDNQSVLNQFALTDDPNSAVNGYGLVMNYTNFKVNPNSVDPLFAVAADDSVDTDEFLCSSFFDVKVVRNLDTDGLPY